MLKILMYAYFYALFFTKKANIALKNGIISINSKEDLVQKYESARRESK